MIKNPSKTSVWVVEDKVLALPMIKVGLDLWVLWDAYAKSLNHSFIHSTNIDGGQRGYYYVSGSRLEAGDIKIQKKIHSL